MADSGGTKRVRRSKGHTFRVWAPNAGRAEIVAGGNVSALDMSSSGWFEGHIADAGPNTDYGFILDGQGPYPDPRSAWQPEGIDGPSRLVDHAAYKWTDGAWTGRPLRSAVIYELHVGTFTPEGTFNGVITRLPYLKELGVNAIELMPVNQFPGSRGWGYDGASLFAPHNTYGAPDDLKRLVDLCHSHGISVIQDVVYNHLGPAGNHLSKYGPYFTDRYSTPWGDAVNLDGPDSDEVRRFFIDNALMWLGDYHFDGIRIDAVHALTDMSAMHLVEEIVHSVRALEARAGRTLWVIAESDLNDPRVVRAPELGGFGADAQWSDDLHHSLHSVITGEDRGYYADFGYVSQVAKSLREAFVYSGRRSTFRGRKHGRPTTGLTGDRFLAYSQNHDQVGNRALGERTAALVSPDLLKIAAAIIITSPFIPMLFQGEEWGAGTPFLYFTDHSDPALGRAVTEGRRTEFEGFGWSEHTIPDPQNQDTFEWSILSWEEQEDPKHAELLDWYKSLLALRRTTPDLADGRMDAVATRYDEKEKWLVVERGAITVACNFSKSKAKVPLPAARTAETLLVSAETPGRTGIIVQLPPESVTIYSA
ncbi:MAG TPA: malto-oligosyltrehalose trehalohydrolase [Actinomycetota bacterium]|nr:malto-oligosyltrehalose trehalohydrolase [Actinomycetota bacterium]